MSNQNYDDLEQKTRMITKKVLEYLDIVAEKSGMPVEQICYLLLVTVLFFTLIGTCKNIISNFVGIIYPAFKSFEALES